MKEINNKFKNTFDKIKLDDKIINNNMNKILYKNNKNKLTLSLRYALVIMLALIVTISGSVYVIANKTNNPITDNSNEYKTKLDFDLKPIDKNITKDDISKKNYSYKEAEELLGISLLKLNVGEDYSINVYPKYNNDRLHFVSLTYTNKKKEYEINSNNPYKIHYLKAYAIYDDEIDKDNYSGYETSKKDFETYFVESTNKDITATVLYSSTHNSQVMFIYKNVYYKFEFIYNITKEEYTEEDKKIILNYIQDALDNIFVEEI